MTFGGEICVGIIFSDLADDIFLWSDESTNFSSSVWFGVVLVMIRTSRLPTQHFDQYAPIVFRRMQWDSL